MTGSCLKNVVMVFICLLLVSCSSTRIDGTRGVQNEKDITASKHRVLVAYQSKYGSTRQYAEWICRDISGDLFDLDREGKPDFPRYDMIVFGGYFRMGRISVAPVLIEYWKDIRGKKIALFTTSGTPPDHANIRKVYDGSFPEEIRKEIRYFPLRGRILRKDIGFFDTILIAVGRLVEKDETLRAFMKEDFDGVKKENLQPLLDYVKTVVP